LLLCFCAKDIPEFPVLVFLMQHIHNNLMKLGGSLGDVPQNLKKNLLKNSIYYGLLVHFQEYNIYFKYNLYSINCTLENGLTVRNISSFHYKFFSFFVERYLVTLQVII
jgi:hypothetical protein